MFLKNKLSVKKYEAIITASEFKKHFGKYAKLAQKQEFSVTSFGKVIFKVVPVKPDKKTAAMSLVGILPKDATIGEDLSERG